MPELLLENLVKELKMPSRINTEEPLIVIEPQQELRAILVHHLKKIGFQNVIHTYNAYEAMSKMFSTANISSVICNMELPLMSGIELLQELRETNELRRPPFTMTISTPSKAHIMYALENGVDEILVKPYTLNDIAPKLQSAFKKFYNPNNPERIYELSKFHLRKQDYEKAKIIYELLKKTNPESARPLVGIAKCYVYQDKISEALSTLDEAIAKNPYYVHAFSLKGEILFNQNDLQQGLENFKKAIQLSPLNPLRYEKTVDIILKLQKYDDAIEILNLAIQNKLDFPPLYHSLSKLYYIKKDYKLAIKYIKEALISEPNSTVYLNLLAISYKEIGDTTEALKTYNTALKINPDDLTSLYNKGILCYSMNKLDEALKIFERIYAKDPSFQDVGAKLKEISATQHSGGKVA